VLLGTIFAADWVIHRRDPRWLVIGVFDEPAHLASAALVSRRPAFLVGAVLPDLDHIPLALAPDHPKGGDPRPKSHCLLLTATVALVSPAAAAGTLVHFARDLADDSGVPLLWPLSDRAVKVPYPLYGLTAAALALHKAVNPS